VTNGWTDDDNEDVCVTARHACLNHTLVNNKLIT